MIKPGPTPVPPEVAAAMARPLIHHRSPDINVLL
jgi:aspartate aminotransferase-like enzyme